MCNVSDVNNKEYVLLGTCVLHYLSLSEASLRTPSLSLGDQSRVLRKVLLDEPELND